MSAYITLATPMIDTECLIAALVDLGFRKADIEHHAQPVAIVGYGMQSANIVLRRAQVGTLISDVGFLRTQTGYRALISDDDQRRFGGNWLERVQAAYDARLREKEARMAEEERRRVEEQRRQVIEAQRQSIHERARKLGYRVDEKREAGKLRMVLVKRSY